MPNAADIKLDDNTSFLLVGEGGTKKTTFLGTCPAPIYVGDFDNGLAPLAGRADIDYDRFIEVSKDQKLSAWQRTEGWYEWGTAYPAFLVRINEIGTSIDKQECKYRTLGIDSLTRLTDCVLSYIVRSNGGEFKDPRQMWGVFLNNMSALFSQFTAWPLMKVLTAHVRRDENLLQGTVEKLPLVPGQFSGKVGIYFDEVYYTGVRRDAKGKPEFYLQTVSDNISRQAKSRKYNLPDGTETDYHAIERWLKTRKP